MRTRVGVVGRQLPLYRCRTRVISERVVVAVAAVVLVSVVVRLTSIIDRPLYICIVHAKHLECYAGLAGVGPISQGRYSVTPLERINLCAYGGGGFHRKGAR